MSTYGFAPGRPAQPSVVDELAAARTRMVVREPHEQPPVVEPSPYALPDLPWVRGPEDRGKRLTFREVEVLGLVRDGAIGKQIAVDLAISEQTVKNHMSTIFRKLGVPDRTSAVIAACRAGLLAIEGIVPGADIARMVDLIGERLGHIEVIQASIVDLHRRLIEAIAAVPAAPQSDAELPAQAPMPRPAHCTTDGCDEPLAAYRGRGRLPTHCESHVARRAA